MSEEQTSNSPLISIIVLLLLVGGGWYFFQHYQIAGLDQVSILEKSADGTGEELDASAYLSIDGGDSVASPDAAITASESEAAENPFTLARKNTEPAVAAEPAPPLPNLRIAAWALPGFVSAKLSEPATRKNLVRILRQFDVIALQQISSAQRDLLPRILDSVNDGDPRYDYVIGEPTGPSDRSVRLAFLFDKARLQVDRWQTYSVADPNDQMTFDPLVAWFRTVGPAAASAWTFSLVNVQVDLARAPQEVALLSNIMASVRFDGRGEDDVILAGLFQADDAYLLATMNSKELETAVHQRPTDIDGQHQISNILLDSEATSEYVGRGGTLDFLRTFNLSLAEAATITSQLPVYAEFSVNEGRPF